MPPVTVVSTETADKGLAARAAGVIFSPRSTYTGIAARPRVLGALALVLAVGISGSYAFLSTEVGKDAVLDMMIRRIESTGRPVTDQAYATIQRIAANAPILTVGGQLVLIPLRTLVVAGIALAVFNAILGGSGTFKQVLAVVAHAQILLAVQTLFALPLEYAKGSMASPTSLAVFLPFLDEGSFAANLFGSIDLFLIWVIVNLAIGLGVLYRRRTAPIATSILVTYGVIALVYAAVRAALSGA